ATHIDSLGHVWKGEHLYNGHPSAGVSSRGLRHCGIDKLPGIVTRGVLLDVPGWLGRDELEPSHEITAAELSGCAAAAGVEVGAGDAVLLRTGWPRMYERDRHTYVWRSPGIGLEGARWLAERDVTLIGADNLGVEVRRQGAPWDLPVHL